MYNLCKRKVKFSPAELYKLSLFTCSSQCSLLSNNAHRRKLHTLVCSIAALSPLYLKLKLTVNCISSLSCKRNGFTAEPWHNMCRVHSKNFSAHIYMYTYLCIPMYSCVYISLGVFQLKDNSPLTISWPYELYGINLVCSFCWLVASIQSMFSHILHSNWKCKMKEKGKESVRKNQEWHEQILLLYL